MFSLAKIYNHQIYYAVDGTGTYTIAGQTFTNPTEQDYISAGFTELPSNTPPAGYMNEYFVDKRTVSKLVKVGKKYTGEMQNGNRNVVESDNYEYRDVEEEFINVKVVEGGSDYISSSEKGAAGGVAELDANSLVQVANLPVATLSQKGVVRPRTSYGTQMVNDYIAIKGALDSWIDAKTNTYSPITPDHLNYAVRSVLRNVTVIPAATAAYSLLDSSATTNRHSSDYSHAPNTESVYTLPTVASDSLVHEITLELHFLAYERYVTGDSGSAYAWKNGSTILYTDTETPSDGITLAYTDASLTEGEVTVAAYDSTNNAIATCVSYEFEDLEGETLVPIGDLPDIIPGSVVQFLCRWSLSLNKWCIMAIPME